MIINILVSRIALICCSVVFPVWAHGSESSKSTGIFDTKRRNFEVVGSFLPSTWLPTKRYDVGATNLSDDQKRKFLNKEVILNKYLASIDGTVCILPYYKVYTVNIREYLDLSKRIRPSQLEIQADSLALISISCEGKREFVNFLHAAAHTLLVKDDTTLMLGVMNLREIKRGCVLRYGFRGEGKFESDIPIQSPVLTLRVQSCSDSGAGIVTITNLAGTVIHQEDIGQSCLTPRKIKIHENFAIIRRLRIRIDCDEESVDCHWNIVIHAE